MLSGAQRSRNISFLRCQTDRALREILRLRPAGFAQHDRHNTMYKLNINIYLLMHEEIKDGLLQSIANTLSVYAYHIKDAGIATRNMSASIWRTSSPGVCPITVLWNWGRKSCYNWPFSSRRSCWVFVPELVSWIPLLYGYVVTSASWFTKPLKVLHSVENVPWGDSSASNCTWLSMTKGEILNFMFTPGNVDDREPLKQTWFQ